MTRRELFLLGAAMAVPRLVSAQQVGTALVGVLDPTPDPLQSTLAALHEGLEDAGHDRGLVPVEYRRTAWTDNRFYPLLSLAIDLVIRDVGVIVTGFRGIQAAKAATSSIPIVFFAGRDVIEAGLLESPDRPGGNLAGIVIPSQGDLKQLDLRAKLLPAARLMAVLANPNNKAAETEIQELRQ